MSLRRQLVQACDDVSIRRQCELIGISRSGFYYEPVPESQQNLALMRQLDELHMSFPAFGSRRLAVVLQRQGHEVNRKRVTRLLKLMGVEAVYPKRCLSQPGEGHRIYPYLLEGLEITGPDQVWCSDITYCHKTPLPGWVRQLSERAGRWLPGEWERRSVGEFPTELSRHGVAPPGVPCGLFQYRFAQSAPPVWVGLGVGF